MDPLANQDPAAFTPLAAERAAIRPDPTVNHYPFAHDNVAHLFDDPRAPDIAVVHTAAHNWAERGGHLGEHGSLDVVQSRAPLILAGRGVRPAGRLDAAARMIDVAPTIRALLGIASDPPGDGRVLTEALAPGERPSRVIAVLCDGTNANVATAMAQAGELPTLAGLMDAGTWYGHGLIASFPSVTLANHTTAITGVHPGRHGVLHNFFYDRARQRSIVTNAPEVWHEAVRFIRPDAETLFESVARAGGGFTAAVNEPSDRGASYATFDLVRSGAVGGAAAAIPAGDDVPGATRAFVEADERYAWSVGADHLAVQQATDALTGALGEVPRLLWVNMILPDTANHIAGPYAAMAAAGMRETDRRLGQILAHAGEDAAVVVLADHGMEESDPACTGDWKPALDAAGIPYRDEGEGFLYLDP